MRLIVKGIRNKWKMIRINKKKLIRINKKKFIRINKEKVIKKKLIRKY
jgi:hypothetical protein